MPLNIYQAYMRSVAQDPVDEWRTATQEMINDTWLDTSTLENVQGQTNVGQTTYATESVQLNSVISPKTGQSFGDDYRKIIYQNYEQNVLSPEQNPSGNSLRFLGKYYKFNNSTWLTINTNTIVGALTTAIVRRCNNTLKWYDKAGVLHEWACVFDRDLSATNLDEGSQGVAEIGADAIIQVQRNSETDSIPYNQRFIFDGHAFQIKQINNHVSSTYMEFYVFEIQVQANDDLTNDIANSTGEITPTADKIQILPQITTISQGESQLFTVYRYVNGEQTSDTFNIEATGPVVGVNYNLTNITGNSFVVENLIASSTPLNIVCVDTVTQDKQSINVLLTGGW